MRRAATIATAGLAFLVSAAPAAARPAHVTIPPQHSIELHLRATHGYRVTIQPGLDVTKPNPNVLILARKGSHLRVMYAAHGRVTPDGEIDTTLPGVGRIAVHFRTTQVTHERAWPGCKGDPTLIRRGRFEGTIELHGERGYTRVDRSSVPGTITHSFRQVCRTHRSADAGGGGSVPAGPTFVIAGQRGARGVEFDALQIDREPSMPERSVLYSASVFRRGHGFFVWSMAFATAGEATFSTAGQDGAVEEVTVAPPAPFHGSATFRLDSPTSSTWKGDLSVELPGFGRRTLAGPRFWSALCEGGDCTKTLPPGTRMAIGYAEVGARSAAAATKRPVFPPSRRWE